MLKRRLTAVLLTMVAISCPSHGISGGGASPDVALDRSAAGSTVELRRGQGLTVTLPGNPTTGYVWELVPGFESILAVQGKPQFTPDSSKLGAGGVYRFSFQADQPGKVHVKMIYRRPFDKESAPAETFEVTVVVGKSD
jgi:inhibitor of cysteine peptidase